MNRLGYVLAAEKTTVLASDMGLAKKASLALGVGAEAACVEVRRLGVGRGVATGRRRMVMWT